jgi:hypothetical protein
MIPLNPPPEPADFDKRVRQPGNKWLAEHPEAESSKYSAYWNLVRQEVQEAFNSRCAYLGFQIPSGDIDHFTPKAKDKSLTYEWSNYRYAETRVNRLKGQREFIDPFTIQADWIDIDPVTREFFATDRLPAALRTAAQTTLRVLNDSELVRSRRKYSETVARDPDFFPLLADAMRRAGLAE